MNPSLGMSMVQQRAVLLMVLLLAHVAALPLTHAELPPLTDAGETQSLETPLVMWEVLYDGAVLTVDEDGNVSRNVMTGSGLTAVWTVNLDITANNGRVDAAQELLTVAHQTGVYVIQLSTQDITWNVSSADPVNDAAFDPQGDLWLVHFAGKRRAEEYTQEGPTGTATTVITAGISAFEFLNDGRIAIASYDRNIYIENGGGQRTQTLSDSTAIVTTLSVIDNNTMIAGTTSGTAYKYDIGSWTATMVDLPHAKQTTYIGTYSQDKVAIGARQGKLSILNTTSFSELETFTGSGDIIGMLPEFSGQFYLIGSTPSQTKIRYFDLDSDLDGVNNLADAFPNDATQTADSDGDGYGDNPTGFNPDAFPNDATQWADADADGYGDEATGNNPDLFPNVPTQWADADGDGYGDNANGANADRFPSEFTQWADRDGDGYGDNAAGFRPDSCPDLNGFSTEDRFGCPDSDIDGHSNPDSNWTTEDGADALPRERTQWIDGDGDGYGDNLEGVNADACPWEFGTSVQAVSQNATSPTGYVSIPSFGCVDADGDGWVDRTESPLMDRDPTEHFDGDGDGVGSNADYNDDQSNIQTEQDHCLNEINDTSPACTGWRDPAYQAYRNTVENNNTPLTFNAWNTSQSNSAGASNSLGGVDGDIISQVVIVGLIAFVALTGAILGVAYLLNRRKETITQKEYGGVSSNFTQMAAQEALEGKGGISAAGGIVDDASWDDDIAQFDFNEPNNDMNGGDVALTEELGEAGAVAYDEESLESIAGVGLASAEPEEVEPATESDASAPEAPAEAPPVPEDGLPAGWTMDQWRWYGHEYLKNAGKN